MLSRRSKLVFLHLCSVVSLTNCVQLVPVKEGMLQLNGENAFESAGYYGIVDDNSVYVISKDTKVSTHLNSKTAGLTVGDRWFTVRHENGTYRNHSVFQLNDNGLFDESGNAMIEFEK
ncbi:MAG: hypothetical protein KDN19_19520 [Verrucomicrobiae bacterium]|nr:hypothetical protein [Verrucomicrobiae bacterium]